MTNVAGISLGTVRVPAAFVLCLYLLVQAFQKLLVLWLGQPASPGQWRHIHWCMTKGMLHRIYAAFNFNVKITRQFSDSSLQTSAYCLINVSLVMDQLEGVGCRCCQQVCQVVDNENCHTSRGNELDLQL